MLALVSSAPLYRSGSPTSFELKWKISKKVSWGILAGAGILGVAGTWYTLRYNLGHLTSELQKLESLKKPAEPMDGTDLGNTAGILMDHHPADYFPNLVLGRAYLRSSKPELSKAMK